jgi:hypothetical protein
MINTPTVLILGAGASAPRGFPTGQQLLAEARRLNLESIVQMISPISRTSAAAFHQAITDTLDKSLDAMLERRADLIQAGKAYMARALLQYEARSRDQNYDGPGEWYRELWEAMDADSIERFRRNKLTIITYNYDRSLEYALASALREKFRVSGPECAVALDSIGPIHLHGQIGALPVFMTSSPSTVLYGSTREGITPSDAQLGAQGIKIIHEAQPQDEGFLRARDALSHAERVVFLGFGFAKTNVDRLALRTCLGRAVPLFICRTGFTQPQFALKVIPQIDDWADRHIGEENHDIVQFLRHHPEALS